MQFEDLIDDCYRRIQATSSDAELYAELAKSTVISSMYMAIANEAINRNQAVQKELMRKLQGQNRMTLQDRIAQQLEAQREEELELPNIARR